MCIMWKRVILSFCCRFIGEETVSSGQKVVLTDEPTWIIDPIDGTTNFVHRSVDSDWLELEIQNRMRINIKKVYVKSITDFTKIYSDYRLDTILI